MRTISDHEKKTATLIPLDSILNDADDTEAAFNDFREAFKEGEEPGTVRAYELTIDERGNVGTTKMQNRLGAWPIDAYKFDELCGMIIEQFMDIGQTRMAVRLTGTRTDQPGYVFNKIVMLKRPLKKEKTGETSDSTASIMKAMQEMNERTMQMFQRLQPAVEKKDPMEEFQRIMAFSQAMNAPMMTMMQTLLPALAGRPTPTAGPDGFASLGSLLDVAERLADLRGEGGGGGDDDSWAGILRAITPLAKPALEALPALAAMQAANNPPAPMARVLPPAAPRPTAATPTVAGAPPTAPPAGRPPAPTQPATQLTDLPSGDSAMLAQMKPQIDSLLAMAQQGSDPAGAADLIFDQIFMDPRLAEEDFERLADFVDSEKFVSYVTIINPATKEFVAWFTAFKNQIVARLTVEEANAEVLPATDLNPPGPAIAKPN